MHSDGQVLGGSTDASGKCGACSARGDSCCIGVLLPQDPHWSQAENRVLRVQAICQHVGCWYTIPLGFQKLFGPFLPPARVGKTRSCTSRVAMRKPCSSWAPRVSVEGGKIGEGLHRVSRGRAIACALAICVACALAICVACALAICVACALAICVACALDICVACALQRVYTCLLNHEKQTTTPWELSHDVVRTLSLANNCN